MGLADRHLRCVDCGQEFVFREDEQTFFKDKQFQFDPKRCKPCRALRTGGGRRVPQETVANCGSCGRATTIPFRPQQAKPVLSRGCFANEMRTDEHELATHKSADSMSEPSEISICEEESLCLQLN